jgi:hypothetical protein
VLFPISGAVLAGTKILNHAIFGEKVAVGKSWGNPNPLGVICCIIGRHIIKDNLAERRRTLSYIQNHVNHPARQSAHQFAHIRIPLKVQASDCPPFGVAFVGLYEFDALHEMHVTVLQEIALSVVLREIASMIAKAGKPDYLYGLHLQCFDFQ